MKRKRKKWFVFFSSDTYSEEPNFYDPKQFKWAQKLASNAPALKYEVNRFIENDISSFQPYFIEKLSGKHGWKTFSFKTWGINVNKALLASPLFSKIEREMSEVVSISINLLPPNSKIAPHHGDSNTFYRVHMGINIPSQLPDCGFRVNDEIRPWKEGELLIFNDANKHEAWNNSSEDRVIIVFDVLRKEYMKEAIFITTKIRSILIIQYLYTKFSNLEKSPKWLQRIIRFFIQVLLILLYPLQQVTGVIKKHN